MKYFKLVLLMMGIVFFATGCGEKKQEEIAVAETAQDVSLRVYLGELGEEISPLYKANEGETRLLNLQYQKICQPEASDQRNLCTIQVQRDTPKENQTTYRISVKKEMLDRVQGDELRNNYYLRCGAAYSGDDLVSQVKIVGMDEYLYQAKGKMLARRQKKVKEYIQNPDKKLQNRITEDIVLPALEEKYAWMEDIYKYQPSKEWIKKYPDISKAFARFFAANTNYTGKGKKKEKLLQDIARQYGTDIKKLSRVTKESYEDKLERMAVGILWPDTRNPKGEIAGICQVDSYTVEIQTVGYEKENVTRLGDIYFVKESEALAGQEQSSGGKAETGEVDHFTGTGDYILDRQEETEYILTLRYDEYQESPELHIVRDAMSGAECVDEIVEGKLDMAFVWEQIQYEDCRERKVLVGKLSEEEVSARVGARGGVLFSTERVNATTLPDDITDGENVLESLHLIRMLPSQL